MLARGERDIVTCHFLILGQAGLGLSGALTCEPQSKMVHGQPAQTCEKQHKTACQPCQSTCLYSTTFLHTLYLHIMQYILHITHLVLNLLSLHMNLTFQLPPQPSDPSKLSWCTCKRFCKGSQWVQLRIQLCHKPFLLSEQNEALGSFKAKYGLPFSLPWASTSNTVCF